MGSFDKKIVFDGFEVKQYLTERTSGESNNFGLGSKTQLKNLLNYIKNNGFYDKFKERFIEMYQFIFSDDIILAVKNNTKLYLYFFTGKEFAELVTKRIDDLDAFLEIINRWEGNSVRIDREKLILSAKRKVILDFTFLDDTIIKLINDFDEYLHTTYVKYCNEENHEHLKYQVIYKIDILFQSLDSNLKELLQ